MISRVLISAGFFAAAFVGGREIAAPREGESARASLMEAVKQPVPLPVPKGNEDFRSMLDKLVVDEELPLRAFPRTERPSHVKPWTGNER